MPKPDLNIYYLTFITVLIGFILIDFSISILVVAITPKLVIMFIFFLDFFGNLKFVLSSSSLAFASL